jgi:hypothetical protein
MTGPHVSLEASGIAINEGGTGAKAFNTMAIVVGWLVVPPGSVLAQDRLPSGLANLPVIRGGHLPLALV